MLTVLISVLLLLFETVRSYRPLVLLNLSPQPAVKISNDKILTVSSDCCMKHVKVVGGKKVVTEVVAGFLCPYCLHVFSTHRDLISPEITSVTTRDLWNVRSVRLGICSYSLNVDYLQAVFIDACKLRSHKRECLFECKVCLKGFKFKSEYFKHVKSHK